MFKASEVRLSMDNDTMDNEDEQSYYFFSA